MSARDYASITDRVDALAERADIDVTIVGEVE